MADYQHLIHEIGRGPRGARDLPFDDARELWAAALDERLPPVALGAMLMAMRLKGESLDELRALREIVHERLEELQGGTGAPLVCLPCYNGARRVPNLTWLTALALRDAGFVVLMHGVRRDPGRLATCEVVEAADGPIADSAAGARRMLASGGLAFVPVDVWCPALARLLSVRGQTGVRNSGHTVTKLLRPAPGALLLAPVTHADYLASVTALLADDPGPAMIFRGVDGEPTLYPHATRTVHRLVPAADGAAAQVVQASLSPGETPDPAVTLPPGASAAEAAAWSDEVRRGTRPAPSLIAALVGQAKLAIDGAAGT